MMSRGAVKQLDFDDLLLLPSDMDPSACHYKLLRCWQAQQSSGCSNPSLLRAICYAYGFPYICLGALKVFVALEYIFLHYTYHTTIIKTIIIN